MSTIQTEEATQVFDTAGAASGKEEGGVLSFLLIQMFFLF